MKDSAFNNEVQEIFKFFHDVDPEAICEYQCWKKILSRSNSQNPDVVKLIKNNLEPAENSNNKENFLSYLCEFNIARLLYLQGKNFTYEPAKGVDFVFDDFCVSVKSIHESLNYKKKTDCIIESLRSTGEKKISFENNQYGSKSVKEIEIRKTGAILLKLENLGLPGIEICHTGFIIRLRLSIVLENSTKY